MTIDELMEELNKVNQKLASLEDQHKKDSLALSDNIIKTEECIKFDKRLIQALKKCESVNEITLLPSGEYHGEKI